ncbi:MAG: glycosyltransferase family 4 protein [Actinobacteria bacterium]|nr:glycosyltransferase family 4 protein [Actinomycetota bacterium]
MAERPIAFVVVRYGEEVVGGAESFVRSLAEELHGRGWPVEVLTTCALNSFSWENHYPAGEELVGGVRVRRFPTSRQALRPQRFRRLASAIEEGRRLSRRNELRWLKAVVYSEEMCEYISRNAERYRAFLFIPYLFGTTYLGWERVRDRALLIPCLHDEPFARLGIFRRMVCEAKGVLYNTPQERELAKRLYGEKADGHVVGLGLDDYVADEARFRRRFGLQGDFVLYAGRRESGKNTPLLIRYFCNYLVHTGRDLRLVLVGSGPVEVPRGFEGKVVDLAFLKEEDKRDAYAAAAVLCQPSLNESFSIVQLEAWLAGTPTLVHGDCPVTRSHVENSQGGLWFRDYHQFHAALDLLLDSPGLRAKMGELGRAYVLRNYSWDRIVRRFGEALRGSGFPCPEAGDGGG